MKTKNKKRIYKIMKIVWFILGGFILSWTLFWLIKLLTTGDLGGVLAITILFATGIYMLAIFLAITILIFLTKKIWRFFKK